MSSLYLQVLAIGLLWTSFHCAGMCGPLIVGLTASASDGSLTRATLIKTRTLRVLSYQFGRGITYAIAGASAGIVGQSIDGLIKGLTQTLGLVIAAVILIVGISKIPPIHARIPTHSQQGPSKTTTWIMAFTRSLSRFAPPDTYRRLSLIGLAMGFLPCMLTYWVLGIAATSQSMLHGALIMLLLLLMTTPVLITASCSTALGIRSRIGPWIIATGMIISGVWLGLISIAANGWIEHIHIPFTLFGEMYTFMLF